jgi:hypothetical protein
MDSAATSYQKRGDLIRWTEALHDGIGPSSASLTEMTTPFLDYYGYGLQIDSLKAGHYSSTHADRGSGEDGTQPVPALGARSMRMPNSLLCWAAG